LSIRELLHHGGINRSAYDVVYLPLLVNRCPFSIGRWKVLADLPRLELGNLLFAQRSTLGGRCTLVPLREVCFPALLAHYAHELTLGVEAGLDTHLIQLRLLLNGQE